MRLLVSGFEPFGGETLNPSASALEVLAGRRVDGVEMQLLTLPVRRRAAFDVLYAAWNAQPFDMWLGLGQAGGRAYVCAERCAKNFFRPTGVAGEPRAEREELVVAHAPDLLVCRWPAMRLVASLVRMDLPIALSDSAGAFVCNELLFSMEHRLCMEASAADQAPPRWAGFLHLPYLPEQLRGKAAEIPSLALETQVEVVVRSIEWLRDARAAAASDADDRETERRCLAERR